MGTKSASSHAMVVHIAKGAGISGAVTRAGLAFSARRNFAPLFRHCRLSFHDLRAGDPEMRGRLALLPEMNERDLASLWSVLLVVVAIGVAIAFLK